ncbi:hypothetical protein ACFVU2_07215 [Leifsonia sp. NPDC058194]|uniref:hypothetical protein n=1 Tax=Leifsonia sp. NPDC058194 TaxID=3346374 RepID=UPI0036DCE61E
MQILEIVHGKIAELIGEDGEWTVSRRSADDTDTIFHSVLAQSVSVGIAAALVDARRRLESGEIGAVTEPQHLAPTETAPAGDSAAEHVADEPAAFGWEPAPITIWTDLRKPVTGEIPAIVERNAA